MQLKLFNTLEYFELLLKNCILNHYFEYFFKFSECLILFFKYQTEAPETRTKFINSVGRLLSDYEFDGIDLGWQFPPVKVKKERGTFSSIWHKVKKTFGYGKFKDEKEKEHRDGFTILVRDLKNQLRARNKELTLTVLPHVNSSGKYIFFNDLFYNGHEELKYKFLFQFIMMSDFWHQIWMLFIL